MATKTPMTDEHKAALAAGREEGRHVRAYLEGLEQFKPKRGRKRTPESIKARLEMVEEELLEADPITRVSLVQERMDLADELQVLTNDAPLADLEQAFIKVAAAYSERKGISYAAWREVGVQPSVLKEAGIGR